MALGCITPVAAETPIQYPLPNGFFFKQANGQSGAGESGFPVVNEVFGGPFGPVNFFDTFVARGGTPAVGYPAGRAFNYRGFITQVFQKLVFQNQVGQGVFFLNVFDLLHDAGFDPFMDAFRQIPPQLDTSPDVGLPFDAVIARHLAFLNNDEAIRATYFADPDPINNFGLPMSFKDYGPFYVIRCQRASFQHFKVTVGPNPEGIVQIVNGGDLGKELGLFPVEAVTPIIPTFNANIIVFVPSQGATVTNPFTLSGDARLFEAVGNWELVNASGAVISSGNIQAAAGAPAFGRFDTPVAYTISTTQTATLRVFSLSPANGTRINELAIPLTLSP
jgi:hypothetical protein